MNCRKGFVLLLVIIAVLLIGGGVYAYQDRKSSVPFSPIGAQSTDKTAKNQTIFAIVPTSGAAPLEVSTSKLDACKFYKIEWGDGTVSNSYNAQKTCEFTNELLEIEKHTYRSAGTYTVKVYYGDVMIHAATIVVSALKDEMPTKGTVLLGDKALYKNLTPDQKAIITSLNASLDVPAETLEAYVLKYYDSNKIIFGEISTKTILPLVLLERHSWKYVGDTNCRINVNGGYFESQGYLIGVSNSGVCYYRLGDEKLTLITNSIPNRGETYVKNAGALNYYDVSFNEATKELSVGVFKAINDDGPDNPRLRTAKFMLQ